MALQNARLFRWNAARFEVEAINAIARETPAFWTI